MKLEKDAMEEEVEDEESEADEEETADVEEENMGEYNCEKCEEKSYKKEHKVILDIIVGGVTNAYFN